MRFPVEKVCEVWNCTMVAERCHFITRATLPKELWEDERFFYWGCRAHHFQQHALGIERFCNHFGLRKRLEEARRLRTEYVVKNVGGKDE